MPYLPPAGSAANFAVAAADFPKPYNALWVKFGAGGYAAPIGSAIAAQFTWLADWVPPAGNAVNFSVSNSESYVATGAASVPFAAIGTAVTYLPNLTVRSALAAPWAKADLAVKNIFAPQPATSVINLPKAAPWPAPVDIDSETRYPHIKTQRTDSDNNAEWGAFEQKLSTDRASAWAKSARNDAACGAVWSVYGDMLNEDRGSKWKSSIPRDTIRLAPWPDYLILLYWATPYQRPVGNAANFVTIDNGIKAIFQPAGYVPPIGNAVSFAFDDARYFPPLMSSTSGFIRPSRNAANFIYAPIMVLATDQAGTPIKHPGFSDPHELIIWGKSKSTAADAAHPWAKFSHPMNPGWGIPSPPGPIDPESGQTITIPVQRVYIVTNEAQLIRVDGLTPITASDLKINFDCDSWLPQFSATIPESARDAIMPDPNPVEILAIINGAQFNLIVERIQRNRQFGQATISISGRGIACELDAPYAVASHHSNTTAKTAQQLIDAALTNTGYAQAWGITDWLVPANTFSHFGTPASVAAQVAEASGSVLQAARSTKSLRMLPRYAVKPWEWATAVPDYIIPAAVAQAESVEWLEKPTYNTVYIAGEQNGVMGQVKITGTAGDLSAPMIINPLMTHIDAIRQRGTSILGDTGRKEMMEITMPVLESSGIIDICRFVEFADGSKARRGIVRANSVSVAFPVVRQTLTVEAAA